MANSESSRTLDAIVRQYIDIALRPQGFARKARRWNRHAQGVIEVVDVQASRWNDSLSVSFTVSLGVFVPAIYSIIWGKDAPSFVSEVYCVVRTRLGALMPGGALYTEGVEGGNRDYWWSFGPSTDIESLGETVTTTIVQKGLPFLADLRSLTKIHDFLVQHCMSEFALPLDFMHLAVVKVKLGDPSGAAQLLTKAYERYNDWKDWIIVVSNRLGLPLSTTRKDL